MALRLVQVVLPESLEERVRGQLADHSPEAASSPATTSGGNRATATFLGQGIRPRTWWDAEVARRSTRIALLLWGLLLAALVVLILLSRGG